VQVGQHRAMLLFEKAGELAGHRLRRRGLRRQPRDEHYQCREDSERQYDVEDIAHRQEIISAAARLLREESG
jgi:hypothetical protein